MANIVSIKKLTLSEKLQNPLPKNTINMSVPTLLASVAIAVLAFSLPTANAEYDVAIYCQLVPTGTKFPSFQSCQTYYTCQSNGQVSQSSCSGTEVFNKDTQNCVPASSSNCNYDDENACANKDGVWVADPKECRRWHYCANGDILGSGDCAIGQYFDNAKQMCVNGKCPNSGGSIQVTNECQIMQSGQFFGDFNNCATWHKCNGNNLMTGKCNSGLMYNKENRMCLADNGIMCTGPTETCGENQKDTKIANKGICSVYFQCTTSGKEWLWKKIQCPNGQYYDLITKDCVNRQKATPIAGCNRCEFSTQTFVNAVDSSCLEYLTCNNGKKTGEGKCRAADGYFNEPAQMCIDNSQGLANYRQQNGACYQATTEAPATDAPATEAPATEAPATDAPVTEKTEKPEETTEVVEIEEETTTEKPNEPANDKNPPKKGKPKSTKAPKTKEPKF